MKKISLALSSALLVLVSFVAKAEEIPFSFGIKAGYLNASLTELNDASIWGPKGSTKVDLFNPSFNAILFGDYLFNDLLATTLEASYAMTGAQLYEDDKSSNESMNIRLNQISLAPMLKIYPLGYDLDEVSFNVHLGPQLNMPLSASYKKSADKDRTAIAKTDLNAYTVAALAGVGVEFPFGLLLEARGNYDFMSAFKQGATNDFKSNVLNVAETTKQHSWYGNVTLGYNFARLIVG